MQNVSKLLKEFFGREGLKADRLEVEQANSLAVCQTSLLFDCVSDKETFPSTDAYFDKLSTSQGTGISETA